MTSAAIICGASRGIGLAFVKRLISQENVDFIFAVHRPQSSDDDLKKLQSEAGGRLVNCSLNLVEEENVKSLVSVLKEKEVDQVSYVINCIGFLHDEKLEGPERRLEEVDPESLLRSFEVNTLPTATIAKHLKPLIRTSEKPKFVSLSAKVGSITDNGMGGWYSYRASKAALNMLIKNIGLEFGRINKEAIVLSLHPGTTESKLSEPFLEAAKKKYQIHTADETAENLLKVIDSAQPTKSGVFYNWDGSELPW